MSVISNFSHHFHSLAQTVMDRKNAMIGGALTYTTSALSYLYVSQAACCEESEGFMGNACLLLPLAGSLIVSTLAKKALKVNYTSLFTLGLFPPAKASQAEPPSPVNPVPEQPPVETVEDTIVNLDIALTEEDRHFIEQQMNQLHRMEEEQFAQENRRIEAPVEPPRIEQDRHSHQMEQEQFAQENRRTEAPDESPEEKRKLRILSHEQNLAVLPEFLSFDFHPAGERARLVVSLPHQHPKLREAIEEHFYTIMRDTLIGAVIGGLGGWIFELYHGVYRTEKVYTYIKTAAEIGAASGALVGLFKTYSIYMDIVEATPGLEASKEKAKAIMRHLIKDQFKKQELSVDDCMCPIAHEFMVFPVRTSCNHVFEFTTVLKQLQYRNRCPLCNNTGDLQNSKPDEDIINKIVQVYKKMLNTLEATFEKLPRKGLKLTEIKKYVKEIATKIAEKVRLKTDVLEGREEEILFRLKKNILSPEEAFTLAYFVMEQLKPIQRKIDLIKDLSMDLINYLYQKRVLSSHEQMDMIQKLSSWYEKIDIIKHYPILVEFVK